MRNNEALSSVALFLAIRMSLFFPSFIIIIKHSRSTHDLSEARLCQIFSLFSLLPLHANNGGDADAGMVGKREAIAVWMWRHVTWWDDFPIQSIPTLSKVSPWEQLGCSFLVMFALELPFAEATHQSYDLICGNSIDKRVTSPRDHQIIAARLGTNYSMSRSSIDLLLLKVHKSVSEICRNWSRQTCRVPGEKMEFSAAQTTSIRNFQS